MKEENLVFLISQPRSGSTLLQKLISAHAQVATCEEPWFMLNLLNHLSMAGIEAHYQRQTEFRALTNFIKNLPSGGEEFYNRQLGEFCLSIYGDYLNNSGKNIFLDKTPRYYFIIPQLLSIFPNAKFIILHRHPLSVFYSILQTWVKQSWEGLANYKFDLEVGFEQLLQSKYSDGMLHVSYEEIVRNTKEELEKICSYLNISFQAEITSYQASENWMFGDQSEQLKLGKIDSSRLDLWASTPLDVQSWRLLYDYLEWIGCDRLEELGYRYDETKKLLMENMPDIGFKDLINTTMPLKSMLANVAYERYYRDKINIKNQEIAEKNKTLLNEALTLKRKYKKYDYIEYAYCKLKEIVRKLSKTNVDD